MRKSTSKISETFAVKEIEAQLPGRKFVFLQKVVDHSGSGIVYFYLLLQVMILPNEDKGILENTMIEKGCQFSFDAYLHQIVEAKVEELLGRKFLSPASSVTDVLPASKAAPLLGYSSARPIYQDIEDGLLRIGYEVQDRRRPGSTTSRYFVDIPAAKKRLALRPDERC